MAINDNSDVDSNNGMKNCNDIYSNHEDDHNSIIKAPFHNFQCISYRRLGSRIHFP